jgi:hypothetical protein
MPASTFVSTTTGCFLFLGLSVNCDLRNAPLRAIISNHALEILFGNLSYILARLQQRFQELFLPSRALSPGRQVAIEVCSGPAHPPSAAHPLHASTHNPRFLGRRRHPVQMKQKPLAHSTSLLLLFPAFYSIVDSYVLYNLSDNHRRFTSFWTRLSRFPEVFQSLTCSRLAV